MSIHFSRSLRRLEADNSRRSAVLLAGSILLLGLWAWWFVTARVAVYATTNVARLEVDQENHPVDAPVSGRVIAAPLVAGRSVKAGDILLQLDASLERLARTEATAKLEPGGHQIESLRDELLAQQRALEEERQSAEAAVAEGRARVRQAVAAFELASDEAKRLWSLRGNGLVSELDALRAQKHAEQRRSEAETAEFAAGRVTGDLDARRQDRLARIARLKNEIAEVEGLRSEAAAASERLGYEIEQRLVRAPVSGMLAEMSPLKVGGVVRAGDRICTIVPEGTLKVVALFAPSAALGRIRDGQASRIRLEGFPWTQYGAAPARVTHVAGEVRDGQVRVELALSETAALDIPLQHGLPAEVDVEIEQISPMTLVLRSAGGLLRATPQPASASNFR